MWIGGTMTVPGVSGGSMAMIMGVYDRLISSISSFFKEPAGSMAFLFKFVLGAGTGMVLFSRFISYLLTTRADVPLRFFFLGAVAGGVPMIYREAGVKKLDLGAVAYPVIGILGVVLLALIPSGLFTPDGSFGPAALLLQLAGGFIIAVGLVLPGISVSQMLYMLGIYETVIGNISSLNILPLIPLGAGVLGGIFLTTKVWRDDLSYDATMASVENSLKDLGTDYLDLCLLHWPMPETDREKWQEKDLSAWRALEKLYKENVIRAIGVSNFLPHHLMPLMKEAEVTPMVNQLEYHPGYCQAHAVHYSQQQGLLVEAWSPLGRTRVLEDVLVLELAEKYGKTPAQICLRFALDNHVLPLPKSSSAERMKANLDIFDFTISPEDMSRLMCMPQTGWGGHHPDTF